MNCKRIFDVTLNKKCGPLVSARNGTFWSGVQQGLPDSVFGVADAYSADKNPLKVNLAVGAYRGDNDEPYILPVVRKAEKLLQAINLDKEYLPISGTPKFCKLTIQLALGDDSEHVRNGLCATCQTISGSGAVRLAFAFIKNFYPHDKTIYVPVPTWINHNQMAKHAGLAVKSYKYYDPNTGSFDYKGLMESIAKLSDKSICLFHACAHNPTGIDPTHQQWDEISGLIKKKNIFPFFDLAYQGFASADADNDVYSIRKFLKDGNDIILCQSYSTNMGLYGERVGALSVMTRSKEETTKVMSQLKILIRGFYSSPPCNGSRIVTKILEDSSLKSEWFQQIQQMSARIQGMRRQLKAVLKKEGSSKNWDHIINQTGMFCFTGLTPAQVKKLTTRHHIYLTKDGRISVASLTPTNVEYVGKSMHAVTK